jgi:hypothetical protein
VSTISREGHCAVERHPVVQIQYKHEENGGRKETEMSLNNYVWPVQSDLPFLSVEEHFVRANSLFIYSPVGN